MPTDIALPPPDATGRLALAVAASPTAIGAPTSSTPCDRCGATMQSGIWRLQRGHINGTPATWFICFICDDDLQTWMRERPAPDLLGGTKPLGGL